MIRFERNIAVQKMLSSYAMVNSLGKSFQDYGWEQ